MKKTLTILLVAIGAMLLVACQGTGEKGINDERSTARDQLATYLNTQPLHTYEYSQIRDSLIQIYDFVVRPGSTWTVFASLDGTVIHTCPSLGYPIPADTQLTNPLQRTGNATVIEQPEPGGVFTSKNTTGTYVLCVRESGDVVPVYSEQTVTAFPYPIEVVDGVVFDAGGDSSVSIEPGASRQGE